MDGHAESNQDLEEDRDRSDRPVQIRCVDVIDEDPKAAKSSPTAVVRAAVAAPPMNKRRHWRLPASKQ